MLFVVVLLFLCRGAYSILLLCFWSVCFVDKPIILRVRGVVFFCVNLCIIWVDTCSRRSNHKYTLWICLRLPDVHIGVGTCFWASTRTAGWLNTDGVRRTWFGILFQWCILVVLFVLVESTGPQQCSWTRRGKVFYTCAYTPRRLGSGWCVGRRWTVCCCRARDGCMTYYYVMNYIL